MTFLSILIALFLERITPQFIEFRRYTWMRDYASWMSDVLRIESLGSWMGLAALMAPLLFLTWLLDGLFDNALFGLFELAFNVIVVFLCLGPRDLDREVDQYLEAIELGDDAQTQAKASALAGQETGEGLTAQVSAVCKAMFAEASMRIYGLLFWFVVLGPVGAIAYRLLEQWLREDYLTPALKKFSSGLQQLLGWLDWIPTRITLFAYMLSGSFDDAQQAYRRGAVSAVNVYEQNQELLQSVGMHALSGVAAETPTQAIDMVRKSRGLILRALVVWLLLLLIPAILD